jgi:hypothetical protein
MTKVKDRRCGPRCVCARTSPSDKLPAAPLFKGGQGKSAQEIESVAGILVYVLAGASIGVAFLAVTFAIRAVL